nr:immunoglobulin heavy chain junction region [Mus musculus]MBK4183700.1 immunoglobulin heavy chain junction region [Mus musculus]
CTRGAGSIQFAYW